MLWFLLVRLQDLIFCTVFLSSALNTLPCWVSKAIIDPSIVPAVARAYCVSYKPKARHGNNKSVFVVWKPIGVSQRSSPLTIFRLTEYSPMRLGWYHKQGFDLWTELSKVLHSIYCGFSSLHGWMIRERVVPAIVLSCFVVRLREKSGHKDPQNYHNLYPTGTW